MQYILPPIANKKGKPVSCSYLLILHNVITIFRGKLESSLTWYYWRNQIIYILRATETEFQKKENKILKIMQSSDNKQQN